MRVRRPARVYLLFAKRRTALGDLSQIHTVYRTTPSMSPRDRFVQLRESAPLILPSFLQCHFGDLKHEVSSLTQGGMKALHLDVMDGHFVPNLTYGMPIVEGLNRITDLPLDVHLMISNPEQYVDQFIDAGSDCVTIHIEATSDAPALLDHIRSKDVAAGVAINPDTPMSALDRCVGKCDMVLIMSVNAGFGGQTFNEIALEKLRTAREQFGDDVLLQIDGGVNAGTIHRCAEAGAELLVVGSAIFKQDDYSIAMRELRELALAQ